MKLHTSLLVAALSVASLGTLSVPVTASADTVIYFNTAPPPVRVEAVPKPRKGYVWSNGYWDARGNKHVWVSGHWERDRKGYRYAAPTWSQHGDRWQLQRGHWYKGDKDGDGVPNKYDRAPSNPTRQ